MDSDQADRIARAIAKLEQASEALSARGRELEANIVPSVGVTSTEDLVGDFLIARNEYGRAIADFPAE